MARSIFPVCLLFSLLFAVSSATMIHAQDNRHAILDELAEEYRPGWIGSYTDSLGNSLNRIDKTLAFNWKGQTADARLESTQFEVTWTGLLFLSSRSASTRCTLKPMGT